MDKKSRFLGLPPARLEHLVSLWLADQGIPADGCDDGASEARKNRESGHFCPFQADFRARVVRAGPRAFARPRQWQKIFEAIGAGLPARAFARPARIRATPSPGSRGSDGAVLNRGGSARQPLHSGSFLPATCIFLLIRHMQSTEEPRIRDFRSTGRRRAAGVPSSRSGFAWPETRFRWSDMPPAGGGAASAAFRVCRHGYDSDAAPHPPGASPPETQHRGLTESIFF